MQTQWRGYTIQVTGDWVGRYLFLAPQYQLLLDDKVIDTGGGPRLRPRLEAIIEDATGAPPSPPAPDEEPDAEEAQSEHEEAGAQEEEAKAEDGEAEDEETDGERAEVEAQEAQASSEDQVTQYHIQAEILSVAGFRPACDIIIDGEVVDSGRVRVENVLNPFLLLFMMITVSWMLYVGPDILRSYISW